MKNNSLIIFGVAAVVIIVGMLVSVFVFNPTKNTDTTVAQGVHVPPPATDPKNIAYSIDGETILLANGKFEREAAPGSASKETFALFGEPLLGDLDQDDDLDVVTYLTRTGTGSGTFYYVVVAVNTGGTYVGTNAMILGDRIAPQNISIISGKAVANFAERKAGEAFTVSPSIGKSVWIHLDPKTNQIGELVKDFEGEADPSKMTLTMKTWNWIRTDFTDGIKVIPKKSDVFTLTLKDNGTFSGKTDCNGVGGEYTTKGSTLMFEKMMSTLMFCEDSQEGDFSSMLQSVSGFHFTGRGELILELKDKKGTATLR